MCWFGPWTVTAHSVLSSEKRSPAPFSRLPAHVQGKQRAFSCFISLSHIPNNTRPQKSPETPSSAIFQSLICPFFNTWHKSLKNPLSPFRHAPHRTQQPLRDHSNHLIPLLPQIIPLSAFTGEMLILKTLPRMRLNVVYLSCAHQLSSSEWWHCHSPVGCDSAAKGTHHPLEEPRLLHQWWCNLDERFEGHLSSCLAPCLKC